jgi:hypothetical protein
MTPKEKAKELYDKYEFIYIQNYTSKHEVKQCALICVDEIWKAVDQNFHAHPDKPALSEMKWNKLKEYYEQVKEEIEKL